ncbi:leukocyte elastase inhibitor A-like [Clavelina lepadiformis]|uniref:leukocyte elastase inhibitor A-like n=1 Tax=Clavelina lepadiformis TaxID=159417 RepID=UPI0040419D3C
MDCPMRRTLILAFCILKITNAFYLPAYPIEDNERDTARTRMNLPLVRPLVEAFRLFASSLLSSTVIPSDGINPPSNFRDGNIVFSPMGVSSVLAILRLAAGGRTRDQLDRLSLFQLPGDVDDSYRTLQNMLFSPVGAYQKNQNNLKSANAIFFDRELPISMEFRANAEFYHSALIKSFDFQNFPEESRRDINNWVSRQTRGYLKELLSRNDVTAGTEIVLANAVFFLGQWKYAFNTPSTRLGTFTLQDGSRIQVPMMQQTALYRHRVSCRKQNKKNSCNSPSAPDIVEIPFKGERRHMVIMFPNDHFNLEQIQDRFSSELTQWRLDMVKGHVLLRLPKFRLESEIDLKESLQDIGLTSLFEQSKADFSRMTSRKIALSTFIHRAVIKVEESGLTSSAATGAVGMFRSFFPSTRVTVDRPFIFFIEDLPTGAIVFFGRVTDPR